MSKLYKKYIDLIGSYFNIQRILIASFIVRMWYVFLCTDYKNYLFSDMGGYWQRAIERFNGDLFSVNQWVIWPPAYHIFLTQYFKILDFFNLNSWRLEGALLINIFFALMAIYFVYLLCLFIFNSKTFALTASVIYAIFYPLIYFNAFILSENIATPLLIVSIWCLFKSTKTSSFTSGILLASATAMRPVLAIMGLVFFIHLLLKNKSLSKPLLMTLGYFLVIFLVVTENNYISKGNLKGLAASGGVNFYLAHAEKHKITSTWGSNNYCIVPPSTVNKPYNGEFKTNTPIYMQGYFYKLGWHEIKKNPIIWLKKLLKFKQLVYGPLFPSMGNAKFFTELNIISRHTIFIMLLFSMPFYICFTLPRINKLELLTLCLLALAYLMVLYFFNIENRYIYGLIFILVIFQCLCVYAFSQFPRKMIFHFIIWCLCLLLCFAFNFYSTARTKKKMAEKISVTVYQNREPIYSIFQERDILAGKTFFVDTLFFPFSEPFTHETLGKTKFKEDFFARFQTTMKVIKRGEYEFEIYPDDGFIFMLDNRPIISCKSWEGGEVVKTTVALNPGEHTINIEYCQGKGPCGIMGFYKPLFYPQKRTVIGIDSNVVQFELDKSL